MKKVLVLGANGLVGQKVSLGLVENPSIELIVASRGPLRLNPNYQWEYSAIDFSSLEATQHLLNSYCPQVIINCAAYTQVDKAESEKSRARQLNADLLTTLGTFAKANQSYLIHISTDFIFDGLSENEYTEKAIPNPICWYGYTKLMGEQNLRQTNCNNTVLRASFIYGYNWDCSNSSFVSWAKDKLNRGQLTPAFSDQIRTATWADDLAKVCLQLVTKPKLGIFNIAGPKPQTVTDYILEIAQFWNFNPKLISPTPTSKVTLPANRPLNTALSNAKAKSILKYKPTSFEDSLQLMNIQLHHHQNQ